MITPTIETSRIILRPLRVSDAEAVYRNWSSDPEVARYMRWNTHRSVADTIEWLTLEEQNITGDSNYTWGFVLGETGELFGSGGLVLDEKSGRYDLGYNIMRKYWGLGLTTEAARSILDCAARELDIHSFSCVHATENVASGRIIEKLGFVYQRDSRYSSFDGGRSYDCKEYILETGQLI